MNLKQVYKEAKGNGKAFEKILKTNATLSLLTQEPDTVEAIQFGLQYGFKPAAISASSTLYCLENENIVCSKKLIDLLTALISRKSFPKQLVEFFEAELYNIRSFAAFNHGGYKEEQELMKFNRLTLNEQWFQIKVFIRECVKRFTPANSSNSKLLWVVVARDFLDNSIREIENFNKNRKKRKKS